MKSTGKMSVLLALSLLAPTLPGCGGGSSTIGTAGGVNTSGDSISRGALTMQINFPSGKNVKSGSRGSVTSGRTRITGFSNGNIPAGTHAVKVEVVTTSSPETSLALPQVITPSATSTNGVTGPVTVSFTNLPVGNVRLRATAYPDIPAKLTPIAVGTSDVAITTNATATANVALTLTIDHIAITPTTLNLGFTNTNSQATISATPMTKDNKPLRLPLLISTDRPDAVTVNFGTRPPNTPEETEIFAVQTASPTFATLPATATITIAEPNSGITATATATVTDEDGE